MATSIDSARTLLSQAMHLCLRHGLICLTALVAMSLTSMLALYAAGHCSLSAIADCVSPAAYRWSDDDAYFQYAVATKGTKYGGWVVLTIAQWYLFSRSSGESSAAAVLSERGFRFTGRMIVYWIVFSLPDPLFDLLMSYVVRPALGQESKAIWVAFLGLSAIGAAAVAYLHAKIAFYIPAAVYQNQPMSFAQSWRATHPVTRVLFLALLPLETLGVAVTLALWYFGDEIPGMITLSAHVAVWSGMNPGTASYALKADIASTLSAALVTLMAAATSIVAYRAVFANDQRIVTVFD